MTASKEEIRCPCCGTIWDLEPDDPDIELEPYPHLTCGECNYWIPLF